MTVYEGGKAYEDASVTIRTCRFAEELAFYRDIVGLKIVRDLREMGRRIVFLADTEGDTCIEIIDTPDADDAGNKLLSVGFDSGDAEKMRDKRVKRGLAFAEPRIFRFGHLKFPI